MKTSKPLRNHCLSVFAGESSFQAFLGLDFAHPVFFLGHRGARVGLKRVQGEHCDWSLGDSNATEPLRDFSVSDGKKHFAQVVMDEAHKTRINHRLTGEEFVVQQKYLSRGQDKSRAKVRTALGPPS